ncbi:MAG TPA: tetratricopeptide repeat protein, partial [Burkholderiales bacterium]|nr:tetratricopeptide repeat protein [Burkholderiales bacterium]
RDDELAARRYAQVLETDPRNPTALAALLSLLARADPQRAEAQLLQRLAQEPSAALYFALGNLYAGRGDWRAAQDAYFRAYEAQADNPDYAYNLAITLEHLGQPASALTYYRRAHESRRAKGHAGFEVASVEKRIDHLSSRISQR